MLRGAKNTVQGAKMAFGTPFLATPFGVALSKEMMKMDGRDSAECQIWEIKGHKGHFWKV